MFKRYTVEAAAQMETIDNITVPATLVQEAEMLAGINKKTHFIGVIEERNPDFQEPNSTDLREILLLPMPKRFRDTGEFILSDDRDALLQAGIGKLVWITPPKFVAARRALTPAAMPNGCPVMCGTDCVAVARSHTMAKRIANALNEHRTNSEGV